MKYLTLPRLPKYGPLWETAKDWRSTGKLPNIEVGRGPGPPPEHDHQEEQEGEGGITPLQPCTTTSTTFLPPIPSIQCNGRPRSAPSSRTSSPYSSLFTLGDLPKGRTLLPAHHFFSPPRRHGNKQDDDNNLSPMDVSREHVPPRLGVQVLERTKMYLDKSGDIRVTKEGLLSLVEADYSSVSKLRLRNVMKANALMRHPIMPCLGGIKAGFPPWPEPIRDRDKGWRDDPDLSFLYTRGLEDLMVGSKKRRYFQAGKLRLGRYPKETKAETGGLEITSHGDLLLREKMTRYACMISNTSCILTIHGVGIHGRLFISGPGADKPRFIEIQVYTPINSKTYSLKFHAKALKDMFHDDHECLKAGNKAMVLRGLARMMYFEYTITETFILRDGKDTLEQKTTMYKDTDKWHINPYMWEPSDEATTADDKDDQVDGGKDGQGNKKVNGKGKAGGSHRRELVEEYRQQEALLLGLPPPAPEPRSNVLPLPVGKRGKRAVVVPPVQDQEVKQEGSRDGPPSSPKSSKIKEFHKKRVAVGIVEELRLDMKRHPANMAEVRRAELRERRKKEEEEAERQRTAWDRISARVRGLLIGYAKNINGLDSAVMVYYFPASPSSVVLRVYDRHTCAVSFIKLNLAHMTKAIHWQKRYDLWDVEERKMACHQMLRMLRFRNNFDPRAAAHEQKTTTLWFETRTADEVPLFQPKPLLTTRFPHPFQAPPAVEACVPWGHTSEERHKTYRQPISACLGGDLSSRGIRTFKPRCKPRREVGVEGRRMAGGAGRVDGAYCIFSLWWVESNGMGKDAFFHLYIPEAINRSGGYSPPNISYRIHLSMEDLWMHTIGTGLMDQALSAVKEDDVKRFGIEKRQLIHDNEKEAVEITKRLAVLEEELNTRRNSLTDDQVLGYRERIDQVVAELGSNRTRRAELEHYDAALVKKAEDAWYDVMQFVMRRCQWVNPDLLNPMEAYEKTMGEVMDFAVTPEVAPTLVPCLDTTIYRRVHRLQNRMGDLLPGEPWVNTIMMVYQKYESLYVIAYEPRTSSRYRYYLDETLHQAMMVGWHKVTALERGIDLQMAMQDLCVRMVVKEDGTQECRVEVDDEKEEKKEMDFEEDLEDFTSGLDALLAEAEMRPKSRAKAMRGAVTKEADGEDKPKSRGGQRKKVVEAKPKEGEDDIDDDDLGIDTSML